MIRKWLAIGIILLFVGVTIAPTINFNTAKASQHDDLVEVTTQACGIQGYGNTTVKLTREQYQNLESYLVEFRARLNQTSTREEAVPIFKDAVVELDKYGLLPKGMSVERAQRLVTGMCSKTTIMSKTLLDLIQGSLTTNSNSLCLIYGEAKDYTYFQGLLGRFLCLSIGSFMQGLALISIIAIIMVYFLISTSFFFSSVINPIQIGSIIHYGERWESWGNYGITPANGILWSSGLNGVKYWNGTFYGDLPFETRQVGLYQMVVYYPGVNFFTGLRMVSN